MCTIVPLSWLMRCCCNCHAIASRSNFIPFAVVSHPMPCQTTRYSYAQIKWTAAGSRTDYLHIVGSRPPLSHSASQPASHSIRLELMEEQSFGREKVRVQTRNKRNLSRRRCDSFWLLHSTTSVKQQQRFPLSSLCGGSDGSSP